MERAKEKALMCIVKLAECSSQMKGKYWPPCIGYVYQPKRPPKVSQDGKESVGN